MCSWNVYTPLSSNVKLPDIWKLAVTPGVLVWYCGFRAQSNGPRIGSPLKFAAEPISIGGRGCHTDVLNSQRFSSSSTSKWARRRMFLAATGFFFFFHHPNGRQSFQLMEHLEIRSQGSGARGQKSGKKPRNTRITRKRTRRNTKARKFETTKKTTIPLFRFSFFVLSCSSSLCQPSAANWRSCKFAAPISKIGGYCLAGQKTARAQLPPHYPRITAVG